MREGLWGDQDGVLLLLRFDGVVGQEIRLHATPSTLSNSGRISDMNSGIHTIEAPSVLRIYYHAVLIEVEVNLFLSGAAPYLIDKLQDLYRRWGKDHLLSTYCRGTRSDSALARTLASLYVYKLTAITLITS